LIFSFHSKLESWLPTWEEKSGGFLASLRLLKTGHGYLGPWFFSGGIPEEAAIVLGEVRTLGSKSSQLEGWVGCWESCWGSLSKKSPTGPLKVPLELSI